MNNLSESAKKRIHKVGPNYIKPREVEYYKHWKKEKKTQKAKARKAYTEIIKNKPLFLPDLFRANCPNIGCLSTVDAEDNYKDTLQFTCEKCHCTWKMLKKFAYRVSNFE